MYRLRELKSIDLSEIKKWKKDSFLYTGEWIDNYISNQGNIIICAIVNNDDFIQGLVALDSIDYTNHSAELQIIVNSGNNQSHHIEAFSVSSILHHAFKNMNFQRLELNITEVDKHTLCIYEEMGFVQEGIKRSAKYNNGRFANVLSYSILKGDVNYLFPEIKWDIPDYCIKHEHISSKKKKAIKECDSAFRLPVCDRDNFVDLFWKIDVAAEFVVAYNEQILGYAAIYANDIHNRTAYITLIAVRPEFQNHRIGKALLTTCVSIANNKGMKRIKLEVSKDNINAIEFYKRNGFVPLPETTDTSFYMVCDNLIGEVK